MNTLLCLPTLNAEKQAREILNVLNKQTYKLDRLLIIDSSSDDGTVAIFKSFGVNVHVIPRSEFNHGATRQMGVELFPDADIIIFLTQDAVLAHPEAIENLLTCFKHERVGAAYGRQLPRKDAGPIEAHARLFNYPATGRVKSMDDAPELGIKTAFISNSFSAYRRSALMSVGGFPSNTILGEDTYVAAKMLLAGWKIAYSADAPIYHSHRFTPVQEFKRYFDIGVFHSREQWLRKSFGQAEGEGVRFISSELKYLWYNKALLIPSAIIRTALKLIAYKIGILERHLPYWLKSKLSMNSLFWATEYEKRFNK